MQLVQFVLHTLENQNSHCTTSNDIEVPGNPIQLGLTGVPFIVIG